MQTLFFLFNLGRKMSQVRLYLIVVYPKQNSTSDGEI